MCIVNNVYFCYWGLYVFFNKCLKVVSFFFFPLEGMFTDGEQNFPFEHQKNHLKKFFFFFLLFKCFVVRHVQTRYFFTAQITFTSAIEEPKTGVSNT